MEKKKIVRFSGRFKHIKIELHEDIPLFINEQISLIDSLSDLLPLTRPEEYLIVQQIFNRNRLLLSELVGYILRVTELTLSNALFYL